MSSTLTHLGFQKCFQSTTFVAPPIGDSSHDILTKLEVLQQKKLDGIRTAQGPRPLGKKKSEETSNMVVSNTNVNQRSIESGRTQDNPLDRELQMEDLEEDEEELQTMTDDTWT